MKRFTQITLLFALALLVACGGDGADQPAEKAMTARSDDFGSQLATVTDHYLALKDALVEADGQSAAGHATAMRTALAAVNGESLSGDKAGKWTADKATLAAAIDGVVGADNVEAMRAAFQALSNAMIETARTYGPAERTLYVQHCPMAFNNAGADWLSADKQVVNPYFGDRMLHCGSVTETIAMK